MEEKAKEFDTEYQRINIRTTDGSYLTGAVNVSNLERLSDLFSRGESEFIVLVDYEHRSGSGNVIFVNKDQIVWVEPED